MTLTAVALKHLAASVYVCICLHDKNKNGWN